MSATQSSKSNFVDILAGYRMRKASEEDSKKRVNVARRMAGLGDVLMMCECLFVCWFVCLFCCLLACVHVCLMHGVPNDWFAFRRKIASRLANNFWNSYDSFDGTLEGLLTVDTSTRTQDTHGSLRLCFDVSTFRRFDSEKLNLARDSGPQVVLPKDWLVWFFLARRQLSADQ